MSTPASDNAVAAAAAPAPAAAASAASDAAAAPAPAAASVAASAPAAAAVAAGPPPLSGTDLLTKMMIDKSITTLSSHPAIASRGVGMLLRNLYGILFGPMFSQSWENQLMRDEQRSMKPTQQKLNEASLRRLQHFFTSKKLRAVSGSALAVALLNQSCKTESFEHRLTLMWLGGRLFKIDGMKRSGILGLRTEETTWPVAMTELPDRGEKMWAALQVFVTPNPKAEWTREKQAAFDEIIKQYGDKSRSIAFAQRIELKGPQTFCCSTSEEEGLMVDLKNGLAERLKAISIQLAAMPQ